MENSPNSGLRGAPTEMPRRSKRGPNFCNPDSSPQRRTDAKRQKPVFGTHQPAAAKTGIHDLASWAGASSFGASRASRFLSNRREGHDPAHKRTADEKLSAPL